MKGTINTPEKVKMEKKDKGRKAGRKEIPKDWEEFEHTQSIGSFIHIGFPVFLARHL